MNHSEDKAAYPDGAEVVTSTQGMWNGRQWVHRLAEAKFYNPFTREAQAIRDEFRKNGVSCCIDYLTPDQTKF